MTNKAVKDAVEHFGGFWPYAGHDLIIVSDEKNPVHGAGIYEPYSSDLPVKNLSNTWCVACTKQQFEDYVKEQKMEKQKYKSIPVTDMDIWDLGKAVADGGEFYDDDGSKVSIEDDCLGTYQSDQRTLAHQLIVGEITTRQPLQWYEVEGVFDTPKWVVHGGNRILIDSYDGMSLISEGRRYAPLDCKPLTPEQAAKYGVDV